MRGRECTRPAAEAFGQFRGFVPSMLLVARQPRPARLAQDDRLPAAAPAEDEQKPRVGLLFHDRFSVDTPKPLFADIGPPGWPSGSRGQERHNDAKWEEAFHGS